MRASSKFSLLAREQCPEAPPARGALGRCSQASKLNINASLPHGFESQPCGAQGRRLSLRHCDIAIRIAVAAVVAVALSVAGSVVDDDAQDVGAEAEQPVAGVGDGAAVAPVGAHD